MILCKELGKEFGSKNELFAALKEYKKDIIGAKKAAIKDSDSFSCAINVLAANIKSVSKTTFERTGLKASLEYGDYIYPVINTINWLDSHKDVHIWGMWDKSAKEQDGKTYYIMNHDLALGSVISYPKEVNILVKEMFWTELGYDFPGKTQALIFRAKLTEKTNRDAFMAFKDGESIQNSIRMQYVALDLAINSTDEHYKEEKRIWEKYSPDVVNQDALEDGYFWAVTEAKIYKEGSAVLFGSNEATPVLYEQPKHIVPLQSTQTKAATSTLKDWNNLLKQIKELK